jgi:hypothetical protein
LIARVDISLKYDDANNRLETIEVYMWNYGFLVDGGLLVEMPCGFVVGYQHFGGMY